MIDMLVIRLPFIDSLVTSRLLGNELVAHVDLSHIASLSGLNLSARTVEYQLDGDLTVSGLSHPYDQLPTHFSGIAFKVFAGSKNFYPCLEIKASPAKVMQGHNVFGSTDLSNCSMFLLASLATSLPDLWELLDVNSSVLSRIDVTFSARCKTQLDAQQVIEQLRNVSHGQTKSTRANRFDSTVTFNEGSRHRSLVVYLKNNEFMKQYNSLKNKPSSKLTSFQKNQINVMSNPDLIEFTSGLVRFEARLHTRYIKSFGMPTKLFDAISYQRDYNIDGKDLIVDLWKHSFSDLLKAFEGSNMNIYDDKAAFDSIVAVYSPYANKGREYSKAQRVFGFYRRLVNEGFDSVFSTMSRASFYRYVQMLMECGFSKSQLQNLSGAQSNVVPLFRVINIDFSNQRPSWYVEPEYRYVS